VSTPAGSMRPALPARTFWCLWVGGALAWVLALALASPVDLPLARACYQPRGLLARLVARWGEVPAWCLVALALVVLGGRRRTNLHRWVPLAGALLLLAVLEPLLITQTLKQLWGRVRFRNLAGDPVGYTPFYLPAGPGAGESFPSGHVAMAWVSAVLAFWSSRVARWPAVLLAWLLVLGYGTLVALGRMQAGAHYLTDCLFSAGLCLLLGAWLVRRFTAARWPRAGPAP